MSKWLEKEDDFIKDNYSDMTDEEMSKNLDRTKISVSCERVKLKLLRNKANTRITDDEMKLIIQDYKDNMQMKQITEKYNRNWDSIVSKLKKCNIYEHKYNQWTDDEIKILKEIYSNESWEYILEKIPRHIKPLIITKASELNITKDNYYWLEEEINILKNSYKDGLKPQEIKILLKNKFTEASISTKASKLNLINNHWWEDWEINYLKENYNKQNLDEINKVLVNRKRYNIIAIAQKLNLVSAVFWKTTEDDFIKNNYLIMSDTKIGKILNRAQRSVQWRRIILGLERPARNTYGKGYIDENGIVFGSQDEGRVFDYIKSHEIFKYIECLSTNHKKHGKYVFELDDVSDYNKFYPDFVIEYIDINNKKEKLLKPIVIEFYGMYNEKKTSDIITKYVEKTRAKEIYYKNNTDIYYIGIFNKDLTYKFKGLREKLSSFFMSNFNIDIDNLDDKDRIIKNILEINDNIAI